LNSAEPGKIVRRLIVARRAGSHTAASGIHSAKTRRILCLCVLASFSFSSTGIVRETEVPKVAAPAVVEYLPPNSLVPYRNNARAPILSYRASLIYFYFVLF
jgi:hypothetical protein